MTTCRGTINMNYSTTHKGLPLFHFCIREVYRENLKKNLAEKAWQEYVAMKDENDGFLEEDRGVLE